MKNYIGRGDKLTLTAPGNISSGDTVQVGQILVIAEHDALSGEPFVGVRVGIVSGLTKVTGGSTAWAVGDPIYWDAANSRYTKTSASGLVMVGFAHAAAADGDATGSVLLDGACRLDV